MKVDLIPILTKFGQSTVDRIKDNLSSTGTNASGRTSSSVKFSVSENGTIATLQITGRPYIMAVETGIKPYPQYDKPSRSFVEQIKNWLQTRGGDMGAAYAIARSIHKKGTKLWKAGGRKDIISNVVNKSLVDQISMEVLKQYTEAYIKALT